MYTLIFACSYLCWCQKHARSPISLFSYIKEKRGNYSPVNVDNRPRQEKGGTCKDKRTRESELMFPHPAQYFHSNVPACARLTSKFREKYH